MLDMSCESFYLVTSVLFILCGQLHDKYIANSMCLSVLYYSCIHTCMHACMHAYIHTYIHTYIHNYIHCICFCTSVDAIHILAVTNYRYTHYVYFFCC